MGNKLGFSVFLGIILICLFGFFVRANNQISVGADIKSTESYTSFDVYPNNISFGQISRGGSSERFKVSLNNTGTQDIKINFLLNGGNYTQKIFDYIYIRKTPGSDASYVKIANFNFTLLKGDNQDIYFVLNLTSYPDPIYGDMIGHQTNITTVAVPV